MDSAQLKQLEKKAGVTLTKTERERFLTVSSLNLKVLERAADVKTGSTAPYCASADCYRTLREDRSEQTGFAVKKQEDTNGEQ